ncbi:hypothetical protein ACOSQ3_025476 [Xanthoceras sorbifolium]
MYFPLGTPIIRLKALVDKEKNRVILAESDEDFIDVLFSFLTMPMGTIIKRTRNVDIPPTVGIGCMNNLYESIENLDEQQFRTEACKSMLLHPRNAAEAECKRLKLKIDDGECLKYFVCENRNCRRSGENVEIWQNKESKREEKGYESHIGKIAKCQDFSRLYKEIKSLVSNCTN